MRATFFLASPDEAMGVTCSDALPDDASGEPLEVQGLDAVRALACALGRPADDALRQVVDTTCRSFPVWALTPDFSGALRATDDDSIDPAAERWQSGAAAGSMEADLYELSCLIAELRDALAATEGNDRQLFVLLEETAG
jgi:hypothetical protein